MRGFWGTTKMQPEMIPLTLIDRAALEHLKSKALQGSFSHYDIWLDQHKYAFTVAKMMDADMLAEVRLAIADALANGTGFADFQKRLKPYLMARGWWGESVMLDPLDGQAKTVQLGSTRRLRTIFETNMATAHAASRWQRIERNAKAMPYLRYNPSASTHKRDDHKRYYGLILPVQHPIWQQIFPPNGYGCKCTVSQLTRGQAEREGISKEPNFEFVQVTNPRTGEVVKVPKDITPSFAHNHAKRVDAVLDLAAERHGQEFVEQLIQEGHRHVLNRLPENHPARQFTGKVSFMQPVQDHYTLGEYRFSKEDLVKLSGAVDGSEIKISHYPENNPLYDYPTITLIAKNADLYEDTMQRVLQLIDNKLVLENEYQVLQKSQRGQGLAAWALAHQVQAAQQLGVAYIHTFAAGSPRNQSYNGYYTWARLGFSKHFDEGDWGLFPNLKDLEELADLMTTPEGQKWWKQHGWSEKLKFDLSANGKSLKILTDYLIEKFGFTLKLTE